MSATNRATDPTIAGSGCAERHHGIRLARKVAAGTLAATTPTTRTIETSRSRCATEPRSRAHTRQVSR